MTGLRKHAEDAARRVLRAVVLLLAVSVGSAGALPVWAALVGVEAPHVCHCSTEHHDCVCARCHTDPDGEMRFSKETLQNRCGDDDVLFGGRQLLAIAAPLPAIVAAPAHATVATLLPGRLRSRDPGEPPTPPPRSNG